MQTPHRYSGSTGDIEHYQRLQVKAECLQKAARTSTGSMKEIFTEIWFHFQHEISNAQAKETTLATSSQISPKYRKR